MVGSAGGMPEAGRTSFTIRDSRESTGTFKTSVMTYREAVQAQIAALQALYDNAEALRDVATEEEKEAWNNLRRGLPVLWDGLQRIDNRMPDGHAAYPLKGTYHVDTKKLVAC